MFFWLGFGDWMVVLNLNNVVVVFGVNVINFFRGLNKF